MADSVFSQRDPRWSNVLLGTSDLTIGQAGCLVSAAASLMCDVVGVQTDPRRLDDWLTRNNGYMYGNLLVYGALEGLGAKFEHFENCELYPAPMAEVVRALADGKGVLARVDFRPGGSVQQHWVRILDVLGEPEQRDTDCLIMDPWQLPGVETITLLSDYWAPGWDAARAIFSLVVLSQAPGRVFDVRQVVDSPWQEDVCVRRVDDGRRLTADGGSDE